MLQFSFKKGRAGGLASAEPRLKLADLREGEMGTLARLDMPDEVARRMMELGFLPGACITAARCAPSGDPRVFRVDGSEIALRRETAALLYLEA